MKRDMELVREILLGIQARPDPRRPPDGPTSAFVPISSALPPEADILDEAGNVSS